MVENADLLHIRRAILTSLVSDDDLMDTLVLKGGNALYLAHGVKERASLDLDFSIASDFQDADQAARQIKAALEQGMKSKGFEVIDFKFHHKPSIADADRPFWGGYEVRFKLIKVVPGKTYKSPNDKINHCLTIDGHGQGERNFTIDISRFEYTGKKEQKEIDDHIVYVYTLPMIVVEKIRSICQQMEGYEMPRFRKARPRDFFDIYTIIEKHGGDLSGEGTKELVELIFTAKQVDLALLRQVSLQTTYDFHQSEWESVRSSATVEHDFRFYFDYVCRVIESLKPLWHKDPPF